jgi:hypothetical protein
MTEAISHPSTWPRVTLGPVTLPSPPSWERSEVRDDTLVLAHPRPRAGVYRPTIVVRAQPTSGSLPALGAQGIAGMIGGVPRSHCLANDRGQVADRPARGQLFAFDGGDHTVLVDRWLLMVGADAVEIGAMYEVSQQEDIEPVLAAVLGEAVFTEREPAGAMPEPLRQPPLDDFLRNRSGIEAESVARVGQAQPYRPQGPVLSDAAFRLVLDHAGRSKIGRMHLAGNPRLGAELVAAGLLEPRGRFTPALLDLLAPLAAAKRHFRVEGSYGATGTTQLDAWTDGAHALVASRPSHAQLVHGATGHLVPEASVRLELVRASSLPVVIAAWAGLAPAYTVLGRTDRLPMGLFQDRLEGSGHPPEDADDVLLRMWDQPWFTWRFSMPDLGMQRSWLNAGDAGHFAIGQVDEGRTMMVQPTPSRHVWTTMSQEIGLALNLH